MDGIDMWSVVGNGGSLIGSSLGEIIDSYDKVVRINNYKLDSYTDDVGIRQNIWCTSFYEDIIDDKEFEAIMCPLPLDNEKYLDVYSYTNLELMEKYKLLTEFIPERYYLEILKEVPNPSTGLCMIYWLLREGLVNKDSIFGFDFFSKDHPHHYFDNYNECKHAGDVEKNFYMKLIKGIL